ncbi:MFS transporter [Kitasatospora kifunensis]|uniref:MFS transporter n=1 Tax=Kitasatospora kifunensis TaxID=58351 RepID=A0A7W7QWV5_KITKI|nr:MFS transporter [Kitasatospora kifunensis]MBB4921079.1 hypothetical protein [Kitasatospora kifunensis]
MTDAPPPTKRLTGWPAFLTLWSGQTVSAIGSGLFAFAVGLWVYQRSHSATLFGLIMVFDLLPGLLLAPYVGVLVDRMDRRTAMIAGNAGAAVSSLAVLLLVHSQHPVLWPLYPALVIGSLAGMVQGTAYDAALAPMIDERHRGRANGLVQVGQAVAEVLSPLLAGALMLTIKVTGVILVDLLSFLFAIVTLLPLRIPPVQTEDDEEDGPAGAEDTFAYGWRFIRRRPALLGLLLMFASLNFAVGLAAVAVTPWVLSFAGPGSLGAVLTAGGAGMLVGGVLMTAWGGTRRRVYALLGGLLVEGVCIALQGVHPTAVLVGAGLFGFYLFLPVVNASSSAIWQGRVPPGAQGRVFAVRRMVAQITAPLAYFTAGPLIDLAFRHLLTPGSWAHHLFPMLGTGSGRGIGVLFLLMGAAVVVIGLVGWASPGLRSVEQPESTAEAPAPVPAA